MQATYADVFRPTAGRSALAYDVSLILAGSVLLALTGRVSFYLPISPVPITGQTFAVLLAGALLGPVRGPAAVVAYLCEGACGLGVFASGNCGLAYLLGPTGGYLLGFVPAAWLTGVLAQKGWDRRFWTTVLAMTAGTALILLAGSAWLACFVGAASALRLGVLPFVVGDIIKVLAAALLLPSGWKLLERFQAGRKRKRPPQF